MHASLLAIGAALFSGVIAHSHAELSYSDLVRRDGLNKRCSASVAAMNKRRWTERNQKRAAAGNTTWNIVTEAPYYDVLQNNTCILTEETTGGPYVWPRSQTLRQDITEGQAGIPLLLDIGVMDLETCEPLPNVLVDIWHCNATGHYSSFTGLSPEIPFREMLDILNKTATDDLHTDDTTFLRGMWPTNEAGITEFTGIVPGYYVERTIHIHVQVHENYVIRANGTVANGTTISTGQMFLEEELSERLMAIEPYASHRQINRTTNDIDDIFQDSSRNGWDPTLAVVPMDGENPENGIIGYITLGVDTAAKELKKRELQGKKA